jgi:hypothetical protein
MQTGSGQVLSAVGQERKRAGERITGYPEHSRRTWPEPPNVRIADLTATMESMGMAQNRIRIITVCTTLRRCA